MINANGKRSIIMKNKTCKIKFYVKLVSDIYEYHNLFVYVNLNIFYFQVLPYDTW